MDNLTHSLIGAALGEGAAQTRIQLAAKRGQGASIGLRAYLWLASVLANNIPDIDVIYTRITPGHLGSLLHHRGHTHTLLMALPQGLIVFGLMLAIARLTRTAFDKSEKFWLLGVSLLGAVMHLVADSWNSYGVHPFWPFNNRWYYGDFIFIVEPWIWIALLPPLMYASWRNWLRWLFRLIMLGALAAIWTTEYMPQGFKICLTMALALFLLAKWLTPQRRILLGLGSVLIVLLAFSGARALAERRVERISKTEAPLAKLHDILLSPLPGNFACWSSITVTTQNDTYSVNARLINIFPELLPDSACPDFHNPDRRSFVGSLKELRHLYSTHCSFAAFLQFARSPYWQRENGQIFVGDMRFERRSRGRRSFSQQQYLESDTACPPNLTGWVPPRNDLLNP